MGNNPITILGNGIGLGYAPAGPAHSPTEDIAYMRSLNNIEIITPANLNFIKSLVNLTYYTSKLRYIRLERSTAKQTDKLYSHNMSTELINNGLALIKPGLSEFIGCPKLAIISSGYMLGRSIDVSNKLFELDGRIENCVFDLWKIKPFNTDYFNLLVDGFTHIVTIEEQSLDAGFGSAVYECLLDNQKSIKTLRIGLPAKFIFKNGNREQLLDTNGLSVDSIYAKIKKFVR